MISRTLVTAIVVVFATCGTAQAAPSASFTSSPSGWAMAGQTVTFDASGSTAGPGRTLASYQWDWEGDGVWDATVATPTTTHQYIAANQGVRMPKLRVTDDLGAFSSTSHTFEVTLSQPPNPMFNFQVLAVVNVATTFNASASSDPDGTVARYDWDWNADGVVDDTTTSASIQHTFTVAETRDIRLYVVDNTGDVSSLTAISFVIHASQPPTAHLTLPAYGVSGQPVLFDASASSDSDGTISQYEWDFEGDGTYDATTVVPTTNHTYPSGIWATPKVRVTDNTGEKNVYGYWDGFEVYNGYPPVAQFSVTGAVAGQVATLDASASSDPDGTISQYEWDFDNDGSVDSTTTSPITTHTFPSAGTWTVALVLTDSSGNRIYKTQSVVVAEPATTTGPTTTPPPPATNTRSIAFNKPAHLKVSAKRKLKLTGTIKATATFASCTAKVTVAIQRFYSGSWHTIKTATTTSTGTFSYVAADKTGKYRVTAAKFTKAGTPQHICTAARSASRTHSH